MSARRCSSIAISPGERVVAVDGAGGLRLRIEHASVRMLRLELERLDLDGVRIDTYRSPATLGYEVRSLGGPVVLCVLDQAVTPADGEGRRPRVIGELSVRVDGATVRTVSVDPGILAEVDPWGAFRVPGLGSGVPTSAAAIRWHRAVDFVCELFEEEEVPPVLIDQARRLIGATLLSLPHGPDDPTADRGDARSQTVRRARAFMETHAHLDIGVAEVARACHVGARSVQLAFRHELDTTPTQVLRDIRLERAHRELMSASSLDSTVTAVAARWGWHGSSRFAEQYRHRYGCPPSETLSGG